MTTNSPRVLVTPEWAIDRLRSDPDVVVVDASLLRSEAEDGQYIFGNGYQQFRETAHIPGARHADLIHQFSDDTTGLPFTRPAATEFERAARDIGINDRSTVIVYDRLNNSWAARFWLLLKSFGHRNTVILNGGIAAWIDAQQDLVTAETHVTPGDFTAIDSGTGFATINAVKDIANGVDKNTTLINVLNRPVFTGHEQHYPRPGRIPNSVNDPFEELVDTDTNLIEPSRLQLSPEVLNRGPAISYCGGGIYASGYTAAAYEAGFTDIRVYDGSLTEWTTREPSLPLIVDAAE